MFNSHKIQLQKLENYKLNFNNNVKNFNGNQNLKQKIYKSFNNNIMIQILKNINLKFNSQKMKYKIQNKILNRKIKILNS